MENNMGQAPMHKKSPQMMAFLHSMGVVIYVSLIALIMQNAEKLFANDNEITGTIAFLLLFTISAAIVGSLVFARPVILAVGGNKKEAIHFAAHTIGFLVIEAMIIFIVLAIA